MATPGVFLRSPPFSLFVLCLVLLSSLSNKVHSQSTEPLVQRVLSPDTMPGDPDWFGFHVAIEGDIAVVGAPRDSRQGLNIDGGSAYVYERTSTGSWEYYQTLRPLGSGTNSWCGYWVSISKEYDIAISCIEAYTGSPGGKVTVYHPTTTNGKLDWGGGEQVTLATATPLTSDARFGTTVEISADGRTLAIGARLQGADNAGLIYVFTFDGSTWDQVQTLTSTDPQADEECGLVSISDDGNVIAYGCYLRNNGTSADSGAAYIFEKDAVEGNWTETKALVAPAPDQAGQFGIRVALTGDGNHLAVSSWEEEVDSVVSEAGAVYIYSRSDGWENPARVVSPNPVFDGNFGVSIDLSDDARTLAVGEWMEGAGTGAFHRFSLEDDEWVFVDGLNATDLKGTSRFGVSFATNSQGTTVVAAFGAEFNAGAVYFFYEEPEESGDIDEGDASEPSWLVENIALVLVATAVVVVGVAAVMWRQSSNSGEMRYEKTSGTVADGKYQKRKVADDLQTVQTSASSVMPRIRRDVDGGTYDPKWSEKLKKAIEDPDAPVDVSILKRANQPYVLYAEVPQSIIDFYGGFGQSGLTNQVNPVTFAVLQNRFDWLKPLVVEGQMPTDPSNIYAPGSWTLPPLSIASFLGHIDSCRVLLELNPTMLNKGHPHSVNGIEGLTPLALAALGRQHHVVDFLLSRGANPMTPWRGKFPTLDALQRLQEWKNIEAEFSSLSPRKSRPQSSSSSRRRRSAGKTPGIAPAPPTRPLEQTVDEISSTLDALALKLDDNMHSLDIVKSNLAEEKRLNMVVDESSLIQALTDQVAVNAARINELGTVVSPSKPGAPPIPLGPGLKDVYVQFVSRVGSIIDAIFLLDTGLVAKGSSTAPGASKLRGALQKLGDKTSRALTAAGGPALALLGLGVRGLVAYARSNDRDEWKKAVNRLRAHWPADIVQREDDLRKAGIRVAREWGEYRKNMNGEADKRAFILEAVDAAVVGLMKEPLLGKTSPEETLRRALDDRTTEAYGAVSAEMYGDLDPRADEEEKLRRDLMRGPKKTLVNSFVSAIDRISKLEEQIEQLSK